MCSRTIDEEVHTFGTSGYTLNNVFVLYDRNTDSIWYPLTETTFDAVAGEQRGMQLDFLSKPEPVQLKDWVEAHPETLVMLPPPEDPAALKRGYLGVQFSADGLTVDQVGPGTPAAKGGLMAGDKVVKLSGKGVLGRADLTSMLSRLEAGQQVDFEVERDGSQLTLHVTLGRRPGF